MKEVLYVQAGTFANFVGTHFWNTQEGYFTYADDQDPVVYHEIYGIYEGLDTGVPGKLISGEGAHEYAARLEGDQRARDKILADFLSASGGV